MAMDGAEELKMLAEIAQAERLLHPTDDDEKIIEGNLQCVEEPPSLCAVNLTVAKTSSPSKPLNVKQILHHVISYLTFQDVLNCRVVCQEVCEIVDKQLQNSLEILPHDTRNRIPTSSQLPQNSVFTNCRIHTSPNGPNIIEGIHLLDTPKIKLFLQKMQGHKGNPFLGRCVRFGHYDASNDSCYWENVLEVLRQFGNHIWHVELSDGHMTIPDPIASYRLLRHCISLLPNLKSLEISFALQNICGEDEQLNALIRYMNANPMPPLRFLQKLEWTEQRVLQAFQDAIIAEYSNQLKAFSSPVSAFHLKKNKLIFPNLVILYVTKVSNNEELSCLLDGWVLPNLKKLYLDLGAERCTNCGNFVNEIWNVKSLLILVKQFQLEFLSLFLAPGCQLKGIRTLSVEEWKLDCLKSLEIQHNSETLYEFLKCFPKLEHIHFFDIHYPVFSGKEPYVEENCNFHVNIRMELPEQMKVETKEQTVSTTHARTVQIDKFLYSGNMYESNLWEIMPSLQVVTFKCVWDRQGKNIIAANEKYWRMTYEFKRTCPTPSIASKVTTFVIELFKKI